MPLKSLVIVVTLLHSFCLLFTSVARAADAEPLRVMTFNLWQGGEEGKKPLEQTVKVIQAAKADLIGLQETAGLERDGKRPDNAQRIATMLGWNYLDQGGGTGVISRHKLIGHTPKKLGVRVELPSGRRIWLFNVHFAHAPYQPYQLLKIPYADAPFIENPEQAVREARRARQGQVTALLAEVKSVRDEATTILITGDFNEPSVLDWTEPVFRAGRCPVAVPWPTAAAVIDAGFIDAYREMHPDPLKRPGYTWTPITAEDDPKDRHDRIDFVYVSRGTEITNVEIVGERRARADLVVAPYPSDHRAVVATISLAP
jgi:endonuclease/exonuclease/phosphatase family metal-dependent hydrolase